MPLALGFGIRDASDVATARSAGAQGVVVGTALVRRIQAGASPQDYGADVTRLAQACAARAVPRALFS